MNNRPVKGTSRELSEIITGEEEPGYGRTVQKGLRRGTKNQGKELQESQIQLRLRQVRGKTV